MGCGKVYGPWAVGGFRVEGLCFGSPGSLGRLVCLPSLVQW